MVDVDRPDNLALHGKWHGQNRAQVQVADRQQFAEPAVARGIDATTGSPLSAACLAIERTTRSRPVESGLIHVACDLDH